MAKAYNHAFGRDYSHKGGSLFLHKLLKLIFLKVMVRHIALSVTFFELIIKIKISMAKAYNHAVGRDYGHKWG